MIKMKKTAFIILKSPHENDPKDLIETLTGMGEKSSDRSAILFEDGVYWAVLDEKENAF